MRWLCVIGILLCATFACAGARAADDPYAALLAPSATCGPAADQLDLDPATAQQTMLCLTNYARTQSGLAPLKLNATLNEAGKAKLAANVSCDVFSHEPCGRPFDTVFAAYTPNAASYQIGENIAWGTGSFGTPRSIMHAWLNSPDHRENILAADFKDIGVGYLGDQTFLGHGGAELWSQEFGVRSPAQPPKTTVVKKRKPAHKGHGHRS